MTHEEFLKIKKGDVLYNIHNRHISGVVTEVRREKTPALLVPLDTRSQKYTYGTRTVTEVTIKCADGSKRGINDYCDSYLRYEKFGGTRYT